jgi:hypothetical protein
MKMRSTLLLVLALSATSGLATAQTVRGKITSDSVSTPIQGVLLTLLNEKGDTIERSVRSDEKGEFVLRTKEPGRYRVRATRLAFAPVTTNLFDLQLRTITDVRLVMTRQVQLLSPQVVVGNYIMNGSDMMSAEGFEFRRRRYTGTFADTATLRRAGFPVFTDHLKDIVPGLTTILGNYGTDELRLRVTTAECIPDLYKDGLLLNYLSIPHINAMSSSDFYAVEVYRRPNIPMEFRRTGIDCGVIALWTKWHAAGRVGG